MAVEDFEPEGKEPEGKEPEGLETDELWGTLWKIFLYSDYNNIHRRFIMIDLLHSL